ncbi:MAG: hypothetical protein Fur002_20010 [Anaerolineales bacterium]
MYCAGEVESETLDAEQAESKNVSKKISRFIAANYSLNPNLATLNLQSSTPTLSDKIAL